MRADYVNSDALRLLINSMEWENGLALRVSLETGLRIGDVLRLRVVDLNGCRLSYVAQKTGKAGTKTIGKRLASLLRQNAGTTEWLFPSRQSKSGHRTRQAVYKDLKKVCKRLGVQGQISPHTARKSYAVKDFREHGLDHVKRELQHDDTSVTLLYALSDMLTGAPATQKASDPSGSEAEMLALLRDIHKKVTDLQKSCNEMFKLLR